MCCLLPLSLSGSFTSRSFLRIWAQSHIHSFRLDLYPGKLKVVCSALIDVLITLIHLTIIWTAHSDNNYAEDKRNTQWASKWIIMNVKADNRRRRRLQRQRQLSMHLFWSVKNKKETERLPSKKKVPLPLFAITANKLDINDITK